MKLKLITTAAASLLASSVVMAELPNSEVPKEYVQTGRYTNIVNEPVAAQQNPLRVIIDTRLPQEVITVEDAVHFLLARSGYHLADDRVLTREAQILMNHELPMVQRKIGPMTLDRALGLLGGDAFELVIDPINRKVAYVASRDVIGG